MNLPGGGNPESYNESSLRHVGECLGEAIEPLLEETLCGVLIIMLESGDSTLEDFSDFVLNRFCAQENDTDYGTDRDDDKRIERLIWSKVEELERKTKQFEIPGSKKVAHTFEIGPAEEALFNMLTSSNAVDIIDNGDSLSVCELGNRDKELVSFEKESIDERPYYKWVMMRVASDYLEFIYTINPEQSEVLDSLVNYADAYENETPALVLDEV